VASGSTPQNRSSARSSPSTNTSITRTGLSSQIQSSRHSGNRVLCPRSILTTKRFIRSLRKSRRNHTARITSTGAFLSGILHPTGPKAVSEEVKFDVRILFFATPILAVMRKSPPRTSPAIPLRIRLRKGSASKVAGFYSATRDRVMPPLHGLLLLRRVHSSSIST
jgi:hypothetical protein